ncbi:Monooxygenase ptaG [Metarhizium anisopliae]|uniref:FitD protein product n=2 Tax=Metarhizium robertsii TaxID=568076 RepID=A0A0B2XFQ2_METRA|nr:fitD protein product [Metarhizium robertsii ARSEF 23]EXV00339.1 hypothetical protein X797_006399 [Metarhizium robertsii]KAF5120175.1 Monooxygenase ptaG [Metarhizium anisopliae]KHO10756.1 fitD protein product [Metarhizium robertsii ARSEF 23]
MGTESEAQHATLDKFLVAWGNWSATDMIANWSDDCTQAALPFSMGHPARSRAQVEATLPLLQQVVTDYALVIHQVVHDVPQRKAVVYALSSGKTPFGDWNNEYAVFFTFNENGQEITKIEEMVDTAFMKDFFPKFQQYMRDQASNGKPA